MKKNSHPFFDHTTHDSTSEISSLDLTPCKKKGMDFLERIHTTLVPSLVGDYTVLDLFAGCGGLALGFEAQGFATEGYEKDADACQTYRQNLNGDCHQVLLTPETSYPHAEVIIGGPPCQPFSVGGHQLGLNDSRDGFPAFIAAVEKVNPEIWLFENVRGLLYGNRWYFDQIIEKLKSLNYIIDFQLLNAVNYGVPQNRERIIAIGHRGEFSFPKKEHKRVTVEEALGNWMNQAPSESRFLTASMDQYIAKYEKASCCITPRDLHPHKPSRTLTCRNLAGATGDMHRIKLPDGRRRRILLREASRLQSFPDSYEFSGKEISKFNQVGNAVPPLLGWHIAGSVRNYLNSKKRYSPEEIRLLNTPDQFNLALQ